MNRNETIKVLVEIKEECESHINCINCPMHDAESEVGCVITNGNDPCSWEIYRGEEQ